MQAFQLLLFLSISCLTSAQYKLTSDQCVDPSGFDTCMSTATSTLQTCVSNNCNSEAAQSCDGPDDCFSNDENCVPACTCPAYQGWINCAAQSCWNMAYSCEYQNLVINAVRECGVALNILYPRYFPPPSSAPGGCSCQIGNLYGTIRDSSPLAIRCQIYIGELRDDGQLTGSQHDQDLMDCSCCAASRAISELPALCPTTDPSSIPFLNWSTSYSNAVSAIQSQTCVNAFSQSLDCTAQPLNFSALANNGQFYHASNIPSLGSQSLSNTDGSLSAPASATIVWSLASGLPASTAIAAKATEGGSASQSVSYGAGSSSVPATSTGVSPSTASASVTSTAQSAAAGATNAGVLSWFWVVIGGLVVASAY